VTRGIVIPAPVFIGMNSSRNPVLENGSLLEFTPYLIRGRDDVWMLPYQSTGQAPQIGYEGAY
jgi:hypothetical protein